MNRVLLITALLATSFSPALAQFRGMRAGGGVMVAPRAMARPVPRMPARFGAAPVLRTGRFPGRIVVTRPGFRFNVSPFFGNKFFFNPRVRVACLHNPFFCNQFFFRRGFFNPFFANSFFGSSFFGAPFLGGGGVWPYAYPIVVYSDTAAQEARAYTQQQQQMVSELEEELRQEHLRRLQAEINAAQQPPARAPAPTPAATEAPLPSTILMFRDGRRSEVQNYVIVGNTLYAFSGHGTRKIPLSELDLDATRKTNEDRGISFHLPARRGEVVTHP